MFTQILGEDETQFEGILATCYVFQQLNAARK